MQAEKDEQAAKEAAAAIQQTPKQDVIDYGVPPATEWTEGISDNPLTWADESAPQAQQQAIFAATATPAPAAPAATQMDDWNTTAVRLLFCIIKLTVQI